MGYYINQNSQGQNLSISSKDMQLLLDGAEPIQPPKVFQENLVCVVTNPTFQAAAYAYSEDEMNYFLASRNDGRSYQWFIYPHAKKLSGFEA